jgi:hypothetical protein
MRFFLNQSDHAFSAGIRVRGRFLQSLGLGRSRSGRSVTHLDIRHHDYCNCGRQLMFEVNIKTEKKKSWLSVSKPLFSAMTKLHTAFLSWAGGFRKLL